MKVTYGILVIILSLFVLNCSEEPTKPTSDYDISGRVLSKGVAVENAKVKLDDSEGTKTTTDSDGYFKLLNVPKGNYELTVSKSSTTGTFSERTKYITVDGNINLDNLILPKGIFVYEPKFIEERTLELSWVQTDALDFREYKIFQYNTSGLDETTGTLIHVSTEVNDTTFTVENLLPLTEYFFRVYVMNEFGRLGGSNIVSTKTGVSEIIKNGSFEILNPNTGDPEHWNDVRGPWSVDDSIAQEGNYSLVVHGEAGVGTMPLYIIRPDELIAGRRYKLTYWVKYEDNDAPNFGAEFAIFLDNEEHTWYNIINNTQLGSSFNWREYIYSFTMPEVQASNFKILLYFYVHPQSYAWIDNMSLIEIE